MSRGRLLPVTHCSRIYTVLLIPRFYFGVVDAISGHLSELLKFKASQIRSNPPPGKHSHMASLPAFLWSFFGSPRLTNALLLLVTAIQLVRIKNGRSPPARQVSHYTPRKRRFTKGSKKRFTRTCRGAVRVITPIMVPILRSRIEECIKRIRYESVRGIIQFLTQMRER
jgi:hypothetical protein